MSKKQLISILNEANTNRYANGQVVENYFVEKYHIKRIDIALKFLTERIRNIFPLLTYNHIKVVDIGCGNGMVSKKIFDLGFCITAADYTTEQINFQSNDRFVISRIDANEQFPFSSESFHAIFAGELIEHLFDTSHFLNECIRVLKPNGVLILTTPNLAGFEDRIKFLFGISPRHINPLHPYLKLHIRQFTLNSLRKILSENGFNNIEIKSNYLKIYLSEKKKIQSRIFAFIFPSLGGSLICVSQKKSYENIIK